MGLFSRQNCRFSKICPWALSRPEVQCTKLGAFLRSYGICFTQQRIIGTNEQITVCFSGLFPQVYTISLKSTCTFNSTPTWYRSPILKVISLVANAAAKSTAFFFYPRYTKTKIQRTMQAVKVANKYFKGHKSDTVTKSM